MWDLYKVQPSFVLGFHGCDAAVAEKVLAGKDHITRSEKLHDWLGSGAYFWEASPHRALEWATQMVGRPSSSPRKIQTPAVVGAVIDLGNCLNLFDSAALDELRSAWDLLSQVGMADGSPIPENRGALPDMLGRYRDRAVVELLHTMRQAAKLPAYDTVRAGFPEGGPLYPNAGFTARSHIQIAVCNPTCIRGYFRPIVSAGAQPA